MPMPSHQPDGGLRLAVLGLGGSELVLLFALIIPLIATLAVTLTATLTALLTSSLTDSQSSRSPATVAVAPTSAARRLRAWFWARRLRQRMARRSVFNKVSTHPTCIGQGYIQVTEAAGQRAKRSPPLGSTARARQCPSHGSTARAGRRARDRGSRQNTD